MASISYILATAGHVDHGKSALVRALTGTDPDRLPEEKARGITIDLGFAHLDLPGLSIGIVDVPGHEDFIKNMVAGTGSIDAALLVVAADDGWMPQTEEHLQILQYLGVPRAVVALTKADLVPRDGLAEVVESVRTQLLESELASAAIVPTSVISGDGVEELKRELAAMFRLTTPPVDIGKPRLPVDRVFTLKGVGTVVTGTLSGGKLAKNQSVLVQPTGRTTRIRNVQTHNQNVDVALPGMRVALNVPELQQDDGHTAVTDYTIRRGNVITLAELGKPSDKLDIRLTRARRPDAGGTPRVLKDGARVHVHHGTADHPATLRLMPPRKLIAAGESAIARLHFDAPIFAFIRDHLVIRDWPAQHTLAGGVVLDDDPPATSLRDQHERLNSRFPPDVAVYLQTQAQRDGFVNAQHALVKSRFSAEQVQAALNKLLTERLLFRIGERVVDATHWNTGREKLIAAIDAVHRAHPEALGAKLSDLRAMVESQVLDALVADLERDGFVRSGAVIRRASHRPALPPRLAPAGARIRKLLAEKPLEPPSRSELAPDATAQQALRFLLDTGEATEISKEIVILSDALSAATDKVRAHLTARRQATVSDLRQALGTTRRVMVPLAEYLDSHGVTQRAGDMRTLRQPLP